jgi:hypothetical protein
MRTRLFSAPSMVLADREGEHASAEQTQARILWGLLTGSYPYEEIFRMLLNTGFERRWLACLASGARLRLMRKAG